MPQLHANPLSLSSIYGLDSDRLVLSGRRGDELDYALGLLSFMPPLALGDSFPSLSVSPVFRVVVEGVLCILLFAVKVNLI